MPEYLNGKPRDDNSMGIFEVSDYYSQKDLDKFFANFTPNIRTWKPLLLCNVPIKFEL